MDKDPKIQKIVISSNGTIDVQDVQDNDIHSPSPVGEHQEKNIDKEEADVKSRGKCTALEPMSEENIEVTPPMESYTSTVTVESDLPSVCPIEPMDQSSDNLPRLAMAPVPDCSQNAMQSDCEDINQAWFTTKEDKDSLQGKGAKWRQGMWSKEESDLLQNNIMQYCKSQGISDPHEVVFKKRKEERKTFYRTIAKGIHRPLFAIYRRVLRTYEAGNYNGKYTTEEVAKLKELKKKHGNDWTAIGHALGRSASSVKDRCRLLNEKCSTGKWTQNEEDLLSQAVHELTSTVPGESVTSGILWTDVAKRVGSRSEKQCRSKWLNYLNWKECGGKEWNKTDEIDLIKKIYNLGVQNESEIDWFTLADGWSSARSPQWLRSKWWTIKKHVPETLSFPDTVTYLHSHYARSLKHRLNRHDARYLQLPPTEQPLPLALSTTSAPLASLTTCATVSTSVGHAITVDGEIYITRGDGKGSDGVNTYEMVHLRPLPNNDPSQPTSYIIEPVQVPSLILHQASPEQGAKLTKIAPSSGTLRQVILTQVDGNSQQSNTRENSIAQPVIVTSLPENGDTVVLATEFLPKSVEDTAESVSRNEASLQDEESRSYDEKEGTDIVQDQQLECVSEEEISTTVSEENKSTVENLQNSRDAEHNDRRQESSHNAPAYDGHPPEDQTSPTVTQSLQLAFSTTDNTMYSHSLVPSLVSNAQPARIITNEVIIPQPTLPEQILQTHGDEPAFLNDSTIVVSSPLRVVDSSLAEVTVASSVSGISSENLIIESDITYFK